jgi:AraC family transcriptional regulator
VEAALRETLVAGPVELRRATVGRVVVTERREPPGFAAGLVEPDSPYAAVVVAGSVTKQAGRMRYEVAAGETVAMPAGAAHSATAGAGGARIVVVRMRELGIGRPHVVRDAAAATLGRRLAAELGTDDPAWPLALEGLALELLAVVARAGGPCGPAPRWLADVEALLHGGCVSLSAVSEAVGVHAAHVARVFRRRHGVSVGAYARALRLERAAALLASSDEPLAAIAAGTGYADQSHLTRAFRRATGVTPARFRELSRR